MLRRNTFWFVGSRFCRRQRGSEQSEKKACANGWGRHIVPPVVWSLGRFVPESCYSQIGKSRGTAVNSLSREAGNRYQRRGSAARIAWWVLSPATARGSGR